MCKIIILATAVVLASLSQTASAETVEERCKNSQTSKLLADPEDKNRFYECADGSIAGHLNCASDLVFSETVQACIYDTQVKLDKLCEKTSGFFKYPSNEHKFVHCDDGRAYIYDCPDRLIWNQNEESCEFPKP